MPIDSARIKRALVKLALIMKKAGSHGRVYLPIFQRLEKEHAKVLEDEAALERARRLAAENEQAGSG